MDTVRSYVIAASFIVSDRGRVPALLRERSGSLVALGARYVFAYESVTDPSRVMVIVGIDSTDALPDIVRSPGLLVWFAELGVDDIPALFAGEKAFRCDVSEIPDDASEDIVIVAVTSVDAIASFIDHVQASLDGFAAAGIRKTVVYGAFDDAREVMFLQLLNDRKLALTWMQRSESAAQWLASARADLYPPVFVGRCVCALRFAQSNETAPY